MNPTTHNPITKQTEPGDFEATLRLVAQLPAPEGLADRVQAGLRVSQLAPRSARILAWPAALRPGSEWMRSAAAAAIVFVVVGGGWGVYSRVQRPQAAKVIVMQPRLGASGGFSGANAIRTPNSLNGPAVPIPIPVASHAAPTKTPAQVGQKPLRRAHASTTTNASSQPVAPVSK
jgi:hypothetical protein